MSLALQFVTRIIKPFEKLNIELTKQNSIDSNISDFVNMAGNIAVQLSHFPELAKTGLRTSTSCTSFVIIVHVADAWKHNFSDVKKDNKITLGSQFEINQDDTKYRFIRNAITIEHIDYGKIDFMETIIEAAQFLLDKLNLNLIWKPSVLEASEIWKDDVSLDIDYANQIAWGGLKLEILRKNSEGKLVHSDGFKNMPFELKQDIPIKAVSYKDYIAQLVSISLSFESKMVSSKSGESLEFDFCIESKSESIEMVIKIIEGVFNSIDFHNLTKISNTLDAKKLILISLNEFSIDIKGLACQEDNNVYLISINKYDAHNIPLGFLTKHATHQNIKLTSLKNVVFGVLQEDQELYSKLGKVINQKAKDFSFDKSTLISLEDICLSHIKPKRGKLSGNSNIKYEPRDNYKLFYKIEDSFIRVGISAIFDWKIERFQIPMPILTYEKSMMGLSIWKLEGGVKKDEDWIFNGFSVTKFGATSALGIL